MYCRAHFYVNSNISQITDQIIIYFVCIRDNAPLLEGKYVSASSIIQYLHTIVCNVLLTDLLTKLDLYKTTVKIKWKSVIRMNTAKQRRDNNLVCVCCKCSTNIGKWWLM